MTQSSLDKDKVKEIKNKMISGDFDFTKDENKIGYEFLENVYYITEGHHAYVSDYHRATAPVRQ